MAAGGPFVVELLLLLAAGQQVAVATSEDMAVSLSRVERSLGPFENPCRELREFRNHHEITEEEDKYLRERTTKVPVLLMRLLTSYYNNSAEAVVDAESDEFAAAVEEVTLAIRANVVDDLDAFVDKIYVPSISAVEELDEQNRTQVKINVLMTAKGKAKDILLNLKEPFVRDGHLTADGSFAASDIYTKPYAAPVAKKTVYGVYIRLTELAFMPMFYNLNNTATLQVTNDLLLTSRPLFRNRFGEYFVRAVVLEYLEGRVLTDTVVSMAFLLEADQDNLIIVDSIWRTHIGDNGALGNHVIREDGFLVHELNFIPEDFESHLVADVTREELQLDASEFIKEIALPSLVCMLVALVFVLLCSWEGFCCRRCIEGDGKTGCLCCTMDADTYDHFA